MKNYRETLYFDEIKNFDDATKVIDLLTKDHCDKIYKNLVHEFYYDLYKEHYDDNEEYEIYEYEVIKRLRIDRVSKGKFKIESQNIFEEDDYTALKIPKDKVMAVLLRLLEYECIDIEPQIYLFVFDCNYFKYHKSSILQSTDVKLQTFINDSKVLAFEGEAIESDFDCNYFMKAFFNFVCFNILEDCVIVVNNDLENRYLSYKMKYEITESLKTLEEHKETINMLKNNIIKIDNVSEQMESFNGNLMTIMAIILTAFSIIGFNVYALGASPSMPSMILINLSLALVLSFVFLLLDIIVFKKSTWLMFIVVIITAAIFGGTIYFFDSKGYISPEKDKVSMIEYHISSTI